MKILHVIAGLNKNGGGTSEVVPRMCEELVQRGHSVTLITVEYGELSVAAKRAMDRGVKLIECKQSRFLPSKLSYSREFAQKIGAYVADSDVIHLHCLWQWPCWKAASAAKCQKKPYIIQTHGFLGRERLQKSRFKKIIVGSLMEKPRLAHALRVVATAESERAELITYGVKTPIVILPIGIDTAGIDCARHDDALLRKIGVPEGKKVLLYLSRLAPIKGLDMLSEAWLQLSEFHDKWHLLIVGDDLQGYSEVVKKEYSRKIHDGSVSFPGPVFGDNKYALLKSVDAFVLPTRNENFSIAVQEALAAGLPTVCTKGAPWELIETNGAGLWVDISVDGIAQGLKKIMNARNEIMIQMSDAGRRLIQENFKWNGIITKLERVYRDVKREYTLNEQDSGCYNVLGSLNR